MVNEALLIVYIVGFGGGQHVSLDTTRMANMQQCQLAKENIKMSLQKFGTGKGDDWKPTKVTYTADCYELPNYTTNMIKNAVRDAMGKGMDAYSSYSEPKIEVAPSNPEPVKTYKTHNRWDK